jgi:hypothetical protein
METSDFPPNRFDIKDEKEEPREDKNIKRVTRSDPIRRKKSLGRKFKEVFFGGDARSTGQYVIYSVLIPAAKDMIIEAGREGVEKLVRGESYRRRSSPMSGPKGYVSYNRPMDRRGLPEPSRPLSSRARARHDFDEIVLETRTEAEEVIERLFDIVSRYDSVTVSDLYELVGVRSTHVDHKWGWTDLRGAGVLRVKDGYLLELPDIQPLAM